MPNTSSVHRFAVRRGALALCAFGLVWLARIATAQAQYVDEFGSVVPDGGYARPTEQEIAIELRFGPYLPQLPNVTNSSPSFGEDLVRKHRVMAGIEADWQALRIPKVLSLGPGVGIAYTRLNEEVAGGTNPHRATLKFTPQWAVAVLRLDILQQRWSVPLVFSAKLGAARASWWSEYQPAASTVTRSNSGSAQGMMWALGAMFDLGFLDPARARHVDQVSGVNHMYLFWEWYQLKLDDFGDGPDQLGDSTWAAGLAIDM